MKQFAVFASGNGGNLQAIIRACKNKKIKAKLALVVCDKPQAYCLTRAKRAGVEGLCLEPKHFKSRLEFDKAVLKELRKRKIDFLVLAGFMRILTPSFIKAYKNKILNVHPSLLPSFKGADAIKEAYDYGVKQTGVTIHFVTDDLDDGPIILQGSVPVHADDSLDDVCNRIHRLEHRLYPQAIDLFVKGKLTIKGRKVIHG